MYIVRRGYVSLGTKFRLFSRVGNENFAILIRPEAVEVYENADNQITLATENQNHCEQIFVLEHNKKNSGYTVFEK